jgi:predicted GIY-YIG superfamily endonuclease
MKYVYSIQSIHCPDKHYIGITDNPQQRLDEHNSGKLPSTCEHRPWELDVIIGFKDHNKAHKFETYLKTGSGRAFAKRHF